MTHYSHAERERSAPVARSHREPKEHQRGGALGEREALALYSRAQQELSFDACADQFPQEQPLALALVPSSMKPPVCRPSKSQRSAGPANVERLVAGSIS